MPAPAPFSPSHSQAVYPALYLYPLNDSFVPKHISLAHNQRVKIGRQTNAKTSPGERNGYFDSKVLSRQHAEVWEDSGKIFIKDVKSSNGTFINGERLSPEGLESEPCELKSDDIVEFGIDIVGEDNKTIIHHKVAARVVCVFTEQDVQVAARAEQHQQQQQHQQFQSPSPGSSNLMNQAGPSTVNGNGSGSFNFAGQQRRPQISQQGIAGMGGMGGSMRPPGKSGLTFDHILSRLQGELQKSRETGAELHTLAGAMNEINETLGGTMPPNLPPYPQTLPPVRSSQPQSQQQSAAPSSSGSPEQPSTAPPAAVATSALVDLQNQLRDTQTSLTSYVDKIRALEGAFAEQEAIKQEMRSLREMIDIKRREIEVEDQSEKSRMLEDEPRGGFDIEEEEEERRRRDDYDDEDARSINTVVPHELERVEEEDEEQLAAEEEQDQYRSQKQHDEDLEEHREQEQEQESNSNEEIEAEEEVEDDEASRRRRNDELGRPRTPEPTHLGMRDADAYESRHRSSTLLAAPRRSSPTSPLSQVAASAGNATSSEDIMEQVLIQVGALMALTSSLEAQHTAAQSTISALESKVEALEAAVKATQTAQAPPPPSPPPPPPQPLHTEGESLTAMVNEWKKSMEGQWSNVREDWNKERERLSQAREEWEGKVRHMDSGLERLATLQSAAAAFQQQHQHEHHPLSNGDAIKHIGLVTPPSPRSLSSDSNRPRRRRSKTGSSRRGRSGQRSRSGSGSREEDTDTDTTLASEDAESSPSKIPALSGRNAEVDDDGEDTVLGVGSATQPHGGGAGTLATPASSVYKLPSSGAESTEHDPVTKEVTSRLDLPAIHVQTVIGVLVLSVAAAAVAWRVRPET